MARILIAGGTGLVGTRLSAILKGQGHEVRHLSRKPSPNALYPTFRWDVDSGYIEDAALEGLDYLVNLAGAGIAEKRWTDERKQLIIDSRVKANHLFSEYIKNNKLQIKAYLSAAAIGFYGDRGEDLMTEEMAPGEGFLAESTKQWEAAIDSVRSTGTRTVALRIGLVLSTKGGALKEMMFPLKFRLSTYFGSGKQWYSWIHIDDLAQMFVWAIEEESIGGIFNAVGPNPVRNKAMMKILAEVTPGPVFTAPVPAFLLKAGLGEMASAVLISTKVSAQKILEAGFEFTYPELGPAFKDLFDRKI